MNKGLLLFFRMKTNLKDAGEDSLIDSCFRALYSLIALFYVVDKG